MDLDKLEASIDRALNLVYALCSGEARWVMSVPVNENDPDVILTDTLIEARELVGIMKGLEK